MVIKGLYEQVINAVVQNDIQEAKRGQLQVITKPLDPADSNLYLARYLADLVLRALRSLPLRFEMLSGCRNAADCTLGLTR